MLLNEIVWIWQLDKRDIFILFSPFLSKTKKFLDICKMNCQPKGFYSCPTEKDLLFGFLFMDTNNVLKYMKYVGNFQN